MWMNDFITKINTPQNVLSLVKMMNRLIDRNRCSPTSVTLFSE